MSEVKDYFDYIENVLGVKNIFIDVNTTEQVDLLICVENYSAYNAAENELLHKMINALKLENKKIQILDLSINEKPLVHFYIEFINEINSKSSENNKVITHSPRALINKPELKKQAWADLQSVISFFKNSK